MEQFKYGFFLSEFDNCPPSNYQPLHGSFYRWIHQPTKESDYLPQNLINPPPARILDQTDKMCMGFGLSIYNTLDNARNKYLKLFNKRNEIQQAIFLENMGNSIAEVYISPNDGLGSNANGEGHVTFHEFRSCNLGSKVIRLISIFE